MSETGKLNLVDHQPGIVPLSLWLQWHGDEQPADAGEVCESEVTWCREKIFEHDVEYVHAGEIRRALMGHHRSELWGNNGLITATMRCVDAIGRIEDLVTTEHETKDAFIQRVRGILGHAYCGTAAEVGNQQGGGLPLSTNDLLAVAEWLTGRDTGVSSKYMASVAISGKITQNEWLAETPSDAPDLGRCVRLIEKAPTVRNCFPILRLASPVWAAYVDHWDELTVLWHQGNYQVTTSRMRDLRSSANDQRDEPPTKTPPEPS